MRFHLVSSSSRLLCVTLLTLGMLVAAAPLSTASAAKKVIFMAGRPSHGYGSHEHNAGCILLAKSLEQALGDEVETVVYQNGWPKEADAFEGADTIVMYSDGGGRHPANANLDQINKLAAKGVGVVCIHYAVEVPAGDPGNAFLNWIGGYFEAHWSVNPHWTANFETLPEHPVTRGVKPFAINDEWYYHMRFPGGMKGVTPILTDLPPKETLSRRDGAHSGNPHVRKAVLNDKQPQHVAWAFDRPGGGRGFGFTGGHFHWNWGDPNFRKVVLNAIAWTAKMEVPKDGVSDKPVNLNTLEANQDEKQPSNFNRKAIEDRIGLAPSEKSQSKAAPRKSGKAVFSSKNVTANTPGHKIAIDADITGAKMLYLVVRDGGNGYGCDWADWINPTLVGPKGEKSLTELKWKSAHADFGSVQINKNIQGGTLAVGDKSDLQGIGTHANSVIAYSLDGTFTRFQAEGGLDVGGTSQASCGDSSSVQFEVYTNAPPMFVAQTGASGGKTVRTPESAVDNLDVGEGLEATLFGSEPELLSLTNLDIDHKGRIWACEVVNYRKHNGKRPEGDRILILEDTNGDGKADSKKVYYQGRDIDSAMGICVLGNKVIVSATPNIWVFTDTDGDDKPDKKEALFTKTGQPQHDHSAHSFLFGPDGKLYWNFGNTGKGVYDADGKVVVDKAGNKVVDNGKPYFGGMPFRCNLDGSEFEVLGHNFRNNYEVTVDSFGTLWQSDNDDDGNRAVRINYVMEFGNYGYRDQLNGSGWKSKRTNMETEVPLQHWHLNDPGVVPNLLQTGAGSPTGITVYEGDLLPKRFHNQVIHADAGPSVVRAYPAEKDGAGYSATIDNVLQGARDNWFRPADVCVAPDGSLFVTDWYDPGVGGHNMQDLERGRLFRVAPEGSKYSVPKFDFSTAAGAAEALKNPALSVRYMAYTSLNEMGAKAEPELLKLFASDNPRVRARALWLLGKIEGKGDEYVARAIADADSDIRIVGVRLARQLGIDILPVAKKLAGDPSPQVRRDVSIALRPLDSKEADEVWAELALQHDGKDRWYLEALGIGADLHWDSRFAAFLAAAGDKWNSESGRDIVWRSRAKQTPEYLVKIIQDKKTPEASHPRYFRAMDFQSGPEKDKALESLLGL